MVFSAHLEYIFHITCDECKYYWSHAVMQKDFDISKREYFCPNCGCKKMIKLQDEIESLADAFN